MWSTSKRTGAGAEVVVLYPLAGPSSSRDERRPGRVQVFKQVLTHREPKLVTHSGHEWLYVLVGELRLVLGTNDTALRPGGVAEFDTSTPHWFGPAHAEAVQILHLFRPHGDQPVNRTSPGAPGVTGTPVGRFEPES
ncbi:cupin domain-containing protein [Streptomyces bobili]|uniref:cupin domain-containing protein n=1 Tax=Streptomyces bobili TaxID=67280 RepID=UPI003426F2CF